MNERTVADILAIYAKHGWTLRRVLLSDVLKKSLGASLEKLFGAAEIVSSTLDGAWFSRLSNHGEAWELRRLSGSPFALVEVFDADADAEMREKILSGTEQKMLGAKS